jgi:hypothetical protein
MFVSRIRHILFVMSETKTAFQEANVRKTPLRDLKLKIAGTPLESVIEEFQRELEHAGIKRLKPRFYLSTEWGVPFPSTSIGIPFYLAHADLLSAHAELIGHIEGTSHSDILRYFRHEMGHVVNYAYKLYETEDWVKHFGSFTQPYLEDYRPAPFSPRYVQHLPGWYAQMHPDEDWSETFAVWLTPGRDWKSEYAQWPQALEKLKYVDAKMSQLRDQDPVLTQGEADDDVAELTSTVEQFYASMTSPVERIPPGLDGSLRLMFEDLGDPRDSKERLPASQLIRSLERQLMADIYRWTGHFPERTRILMRHLAERADALQQVYPAEKRLEAAVGLTTLVASLASNYVHRGTYSG